MSELLEEAYARDQKVWDACASVYEDRIVGGHPDVTAYEAFEEDLLDRILLHLAREHGGTFALHDIGCGSGRLHLRYALKTVDAASLGEDEARRIGFIRGANPAYTPDAVLARCMPIISGIDFSEEMLQIAREKIRAAGLGRMLGDRLVFEHGSAFELEPLASEPLPVVVSVCNSVGVMQGPGGAIELFKSIRRAVERAGGIGIISGYRREAVRGFALGNYESTMDVCGQPRWLEPDTYASHRYTQVPRCYKLARDRDPSVVVDVYDSDGKPVKNGHVLTRDARRVDQTVETGHIRTHSDYESHWYSFELFDEWIAAHWSGVNAYHIAGVELDALRAEPAQIAVLDPNALLRELFERAADSGRRRLNA